MIKCEHKNYKEEFNTAYNARGFVRMLNLVCLDCGTYGLMTKDWMIKSETERSPL